MAASMSRILAVILLISLMCAPGLAQILPFRNFLPENGLASAQVWAIFQDGQGYLWFGCTGGLSRFNGRVFRTYMGSDGLVENSALALGEDRLGRLWAGTHRGPCLYRPEADRFL
jgi:ligand-binding sensor domain-containing protein